MAIEFFTGFEGCTADSHVHSFFNSASRVRLNTGQGYDGGKCAQIGYAPYNGSATKSIIPKKTQVIGFHINNCQSNSYSAHLWDHLIRLTVGSDFIRIFNTASGLEVYRNHILIASCGYTISTNLHHVEVKVVSHETEGSIEIKIDTITVLQENNVNTGGDNITSLVLGGRSNREYYDNIFLADDWQGELKSHLILPTADDVVQFTPSAGADNYALLQTNDGDTSYVSSDIVDEQDLYEFGPDLGMFEVHAVSIVTVARKDDVGARNLQTVVEYDGIAYDLESLNLPTSYPSVVGSAQMQCLSEAPNAAEWSPILINAMKAGFKVA